MTKVWKVPSVGIYNHLPLPKAEPKEEMKFYSLFHKVDGRWFRCTKSAYSSSKIACIVWADKVAASPMEYKIATCAIELNQAGIKYGR